MCFYSTSQHTQYGVYNTPQVLCPEWQILECSAHPLWCVLYTRCIGVLTLFTRVCFRHSSEYCAHQVFTPNTVCNALIKLAVFHYVIQTNEKACTFYVYTAKCKVWKHSPCLVHCDSVCSDMHEWHGGLEIAKKEPYSNCEHLGNTCL